MNHTPTPWTVDKNTGGRIIAGANGLQIVKFQSNTVDADEDAAFIVRAVNCHGELLRVCKMIYESEHEQDKFAEPWMIELGEAIAKAEGK